MILIGICIHRPSLHRLASVVDYWSRCGRRDVIIEIVFNGQLTPGVSSALKAAREQSSVLTITTILPTGHLSGWGPLRSAQEHLRQRALTIRATHLLFHEVYRLPYSQTALDKLLDADAAIAGALYKDPYALGHFCVFEFVCKPRELLRYDVLPDPLPKDPIPVPGIGFGFTLIRRDVLEALGFRSGLRAPDSFFTHDARQSGFSIRACPFMVFNSKVDSNPKVLAAWHTAKLGHPVSTGPHRYPIDFRMRISKDCINGNDALNVVSNRHNVPVEALERWVEQCSEARSYVIPL